MLLPALRQFQTRTWSRLNRAWKRILSLLFVAFIGLLFTIFVLWDAIQELPDRWHLPFLNPEPVSRLKSPKDIFEHDPDFRTRYHPINDLIADSEKSYQRLLGSETLGVTQAAEAYRQRRGRHPPPQFDQWVQFAEDKGCLMVEEFFDRIYHDLNPFWAIPPEKIRAGTAAVPSYIRIRDGEAHSNGDEHVFLDAYFDLIKLLAPRLPDIDIPINTMDEPRIIVPWKTVSEYMVVTKASESRQDLTKPPRTNVFTSFTDVSANSDSTSFTTEGLYWDFARHACPPDTEAQNIVADRDYSTPPVFPSSYPYGTQTGFVKNWTVSQDVCRHAHLRNMHGSFIEPISISTTSSLVPIFGGSKLLVNNDILLPAAMYWADEENFAAPTLHTDWHTKRDEVFWRGTASGGRNRAENWTRFQRHRLVSLLNGTQVDMTIEAGKKPGAGGDGLPHNFAIPDRNMYPLVSVNSGLLVDWIRSFSNVAFYWLGCHPSTRNYACSYTGMWYRRGNPVSLERMFLNKYLPDVDGNSFSGRFRAFLLSNSLPVKATIYTEWHDTRLVPWKHFVPMDNTFVELWSIFEYLFGHDDQAEKIALEGRKWAERVLRKEDMLVYVYRLLLEYARISDPKREDMGFGEDLR